MSTVNMKKFMLQLAKNDVADICIHLMNLVFSTNSTSKVDFILNYLKQMEREFYEKF